MNTVIFYGGLVKFYINNVGIKIEFSFILIISASLIFENYNLIFVLLFSALHELGHIVLLYILGGKADSVTIAYYGIGLKHSSDLSYSREIIFLLGGIAVNLMFALLDIHREINLALFVINALPIYPLDGGRVFKLILCKWFGIALSDRVMTVSGIIFIALIIILAAVCGNISLVLIAVYLIIYTFNRSSYD